MLWKYKKCYIISNEDITPPDVDCYRFVLKTLSSSSVTFTFIDCADNSTSITLSGNSSTTVCAKSVDDPPQEPYMWTIYIDSPCEVLEGE